MKNQSEIIKKYRKQRKKDLVDICGGKCSLCGYDKSIKALEFHHINSNDKSYGIGHGNCHKIENDIKEIKKCILVCANCHREIHDHFYDDINLFNYQYFNEKLINKKLKADKMYKCKDCGAQITKYSKSGYCISCCQKHKAKIQNKPDRTKLKELIRNISFVEIGIQYNVSDNAIRKWCDKLNLPRTKKIIESYSDEEWEKI